MIVVLSNKDDSRALLLEAQRQRLNNGDFVFFLLQHFEVSETDSAPVCLSAPVPKLMLKVDAVDVQEPLQEVLTAIPLRSQQLLKSDLYF